jgi:glycosyltransferase involved in cell wall biosynthesis
VPRVSVLMPTHNRADVVGLAIDSVLAQTMADFELLVVADGCSDRTLEIIGHPRDDRIRVFDLPKAPHFGYANRNVALREARGDVIAFAAHDDLLFPDHLAQLVGAMEEARAEWMYSRPLWVSPDGLVVPFCTNLTVPDELDDFLSGHNTIPASAVVYHRRCLGRDGFWPEHLPHSGDRDYWHRIIEGGARARFGYSPVPTCLHFKAAWKTTRDAESGEMREWLAVDWRKKSARFLSSPACATGSSVIACCSRTGGRHSCA